MNYDRVILELMDRVSVLEEQVEQLRRQLPSHDAVMEENNGTCQDAESVCDTFSPPINSRDTTKYIFDGKRLGKNRLVLAVIRKYVSQKPDISAEKLMADFDRTIQGSLGVIRTERDAMQSCSDYSRRFFTQPGEIIYTSTDPCVVCTQWGKFNIGNFIARAEQLGMHIQTVGGEAGRQIGYGEKMNSAFARSQLIGQDKFMELYEIPLLILHEDPDFMGFIETLRKRLNGSEIKNTKNANTEIMNAFYYSGLNDKFPEVKEIVERVKQYGKQASAHISIYYAMYVLDFQ